MRLSMLLAVMFEWVIFARFVILRDMLGIVACLAYAFYSVAWALLEKASRGDWEE